ncbi:ABC transporter permease subunit [Streptomyces sp. HPF1205]|uniref:ABC transporter permease subunit n=1 Tax=Streptomyces sp. HPF1205 TaxID=2873262 RepID=UPI001CED1050|nr:ABC transporter permease subunit [Streptomyces sp. HPF1205]
MTHLIRAVRAEWTKLRSVRSTSVALLATVALTVLIGLLSAQGSHTGYGGPKTLDAFTFLHRPAAGDVSVTALVGTQRDSSPWAKAGVMLKADAVGGSPSVSLMVTPGHGVRMQAGPKKEYLGDAKARAPYWLRLVRTGHRVTGQESADGRTWDTVATVGDSGLPATVRAGIFVTSPPVARLHRDGPRRTVGSAVPTTGRADFTRVAVSPGAPGGWRLTDVTSPPSGLQGPGAEVPTTGPGTEHTAGGTLTLTGSGDLGSPGIGGVGVDASSDMVANALTGARTALFAVIALGVLAMTSEYRTRTIRTTFTVSPRRGTVLAAKAVVLAVSVFLAGLVADVTAFLVATPVQRGNGFAPPLFPRRSATDPTVLRALVGGALFLALVALLALGVGAIVRRTAAAVIALFALLVALPLVSAVTTVGADTWVNRATPIAGAAIHHTQPLVEYVIGPWAGLAVLAGYTAAALGTAFWLQRGRDA